MARALARHPDLLADVAARARPDRRSLRAEAAALADDCLVSGGFDRMSVGLRRIKYRVVGALILDDLDAGPALVDVVGATLADLADALLDGALRFTRGEELRRGGALEGLEDGGLVAIAMGKHGAGELNYSSDIDLVYVARALPGESRSRVDRLCRRADRLLAEPTADGFCFRVDLNLRPEGVTAPATTTLAAAENHFLTWGRTWERAAWLKARPAAGDLALGAELLAAIEPFRFRRHLDFGTLEDLASMRDRIATSARRGSLARDLKRGPGGIREIEFLVQATQLAWCGRDPSLRILPTVPALRALAARGGTLPPGLDVDALVDDYRLLRAVEHRIQWEREAQTQMLPDDDDTSGWDRLARTLGHSDAAGFRARLAEARGRVEIAWSQVFASESEGEANTLVDPFATVEERQKELATLGFLEPAAAAERIERLAQPDARRRMRPSTWRRFERVLPQLATLAARSGDPDGALARIERFVGRVGARGTTYELLHENPAAMETLIRLFSDSGYLSERLITHPELLDALVLRGQGGELARRDATALRRELVGELERRSDEGEQLLAMRTFQTTELLRIGLDDLAGALPEPGLPSPWLSAVAEALVHGADVVAGAAMSERHGVPRSESGAPLPRAIVGFGSLGSGWMTYGSDVDLVFVYDGEDAAELTAGARPIDPRTWAARQAQRVVTALTAQTREGRCYDVDLRLRPGGGGGGVVTTLQGLIDWYRERAAPWERLAACRARVITATDPGFGARVDAALVEARAVTDGPGIVAEARAMRARQRTELAVETERELDLKVGAGGITDVEFAIACAQLTTPGSAREVADPLAALDRLVRHGEIDATFAEPLREAYVFLRRVEGALRLRTGTDSARVALDGPIAERVAAALGLGDCVRLAAALGERRTLVSERSERWLQALAGAAPGARR